MNCVCPGFVRTDMNGNSPHASKDTTQARFQFLSFALVLHLSINNSLLDNTLNEEIWDLKIIILSK